MRTSKTLSISLPPEILTRAEQLAQQEKRSLSELVGEALLQYERGRWWDDTNEFGRKTAIEAGVRSEDDVVAAIHALRRA